MRNSEVWSKIFPVRKGDRIRIISSSPYSPKYREYSFKGLEGDVLGEVDEETILVLVDRKKGNGIYHLKKTEVVRI